jgi:hypothetical protein
MNPALRSLRIMFSALLAGQVLFCGIVSFLVFDKDVTPGQFPEALAWGVTGVVVLTTSTLSAIIFRMRIAAVAERSLPERLQAYRPASLLRWSLLESGVFLAAAMTFATGQLLLLLPGLLPLFLFVITYPSNMRIATELNCDPRDLDEL